MQNLMNFHTWLFKILRKNQNVTDGWTERRMEWQMDGQRDNSIPPLKLRFAGGGGGGGGGNN